MLLASYSNKYKATGLSYFKPEDTYHALMMEMKGKTKPAKLLQQIGAMAIIQNVGIRGLHSLVSSHSNDRTWQRMKKELEKSDLSSRMKYAAATNVQRCLEVFEPLIIKDYQQLTVPFIATAKKKSKKI